MKRNTILTTAALFAAALFILDNPAANAGTYYFDPPSGTTGNWNDSTMWRDSCGGSALSDWPDDSADIVYICSGDTVTVNVTVDVATITVQGGGLTISNPVTVGTLTINSGSTVTGTSSLTINTGLAMADDLTIGLLTMGGSASGTTGANTLTISSASGLTINNGGVLSVDNASGVVVLSGGGTSHTVAGTLYLDNAGSTLSITSSCTIDGAGSIVGKSNTARIDIDASVVLTSETNIVGAMEIHGLSADTDGTFVNGCNGIVDADGSQSDKTITLYEGIFDDEACPEDGNVEPQWKVTLSGATLHFRSGITVTCLVGDFTVSAGTLDADETFLTTGDLAFTGGTINVNAGESATFGGTCP